MKNKEEIEARIAELKNIVAMLEAGLIADEIMAEKGTIKSRAHALMELMEVVEFAEAKSELRALEWVLIESE